MGDTGTIPPFGHGSGSPFGDEAGMRRMVAVAEWRRHGGDNRPPKRPRGPRFGLLRRIARLLRGGGD